MADLTELFEEMEKLKTQIETILNILNRPGFINFSLCGDYSEIKDPDDIQKLVEYEKFHDPLSEILETLAYYDRPIVEESEIIKKGSYCYVTKSGFAYTFGDTIEFLKTSNTYNAYTDTYEQVEEWTTGFVSEDDFGNLFISPFSDIEMLGLKVRFRE